MPQSLPRRRRRRASGGAHRIRDALHRGVALVRGADSLVRYALRPLRRAALAAALHGGQRSAFGPDGLIAGTERRERFFFWPMGIASAGAMRQWGRQATAFVGRRHFDDADLLERRFELDLRRARRDEPDAARRHAEHPQGPVALQPPHGDPRAARRPARAQPRPRVPAGGAGAEPALRAALRRLPGRAAARVPRRRRLAARLRLQRGLRPRPPRQRDPVALPVRLVREQGRVRPPLRAARPAALRGRGAGLAAQPALRLRASVAARARPQPPARGDLGPAGGARLARPADHHRRRLQRLAPPRHRRSSSGASA